MKEPLKNREAFPKNNPPLQKKKKKPLNSSQQRSRCCGKAFNEINLQVIPRTPAEKLM